VKSKRLPSEDQVPFSEYFAISCAGPPSEIIVRCTKRNTLTIRGNTRVSQFQLLQLCAAHAPKPRRARVRAGSAPEIDAGIHARLVSASIVCLKMLFTLAWYPLRRFFSQAITSAPSRIETACFTGR
jgi:hypothetical protein